MKLGLRTKMILMVIVPVIVTGLLVLFTGVTEMRESLEKKVQDELRAGAVSGLYTYEYGHSGDYIRDAAGIVKKGESFIISDDYQIVDNLNEHADMEATFFFGDERIVTSIVDDSGQRLVGTKANEVVVDAVINKGETYYDKNIKINGQDYFGYYIPVKQPGTGENIGMFFTGRTSAQVNESITAGINKMLVIMIVVMLLAVTGVCIIATSITGAIKRAVKELNVVAGGCLTKEPRKRDLKRKDEIGEITHATEKLKEDLKMMIGGIKETAVILETSSQELNLTAETNHSTTQDLERAIGELAAVAATEAEETEDATEHVIEMGNLIEETVEDVNQLNTNAISMKCIGNEAIVILEQLNETNEKAKGAIEEISKQTTTTNESAQQIKQATAIITSIAEETNLLALNASIEAARAGEQGRGFAVVASQIQKLAEQSNESTNKIETIISNLLRDSESAVAAMEEVKAITFLQSENVDRTKYKFIEVNTGIGTSLARAEEIKSRTEKLDMARKSVVKIVQNLSASVEENAVSTEETSTAATKLEATVGQMREAAESLRNIGETLVKNVQVFEM